MSESESMRFTTDDPDYCIMCNDWPGGSHYHCGNCGEPSGMLGHRWKNEWSCEKRDVEWPEEWSPEYEVGDMIG